MASLCFRCTQRVHVSDATDVAAIGVVFGVHWQRVHVSLMLMMLLLLLLLLLVVLR